jgi:SP family facilitated glucose transporter-like MFS transporter 11
VFDLPPGVRPPAVPIEEEVCRSAKDPAPPPEVGDVGTVGVFTVGVETVGVETVGVETVGVDVVGVETVGVVTVVGRVTGVGGTVVVVLGTVVVGTVVVTGRLGRAGTFTTPAAMTDTVAIAVSAAIRFRLPVPIGTLVYLGQRSSKRPTLGDAARGETGAETSGGAAGRAHEVAAPL